jgi:hypothetical protein
MSNQQQGNQQKQGQSAPTEKPAEQGQAAQTQTTQESTAQDPGKDAPSTAQQEAAVSPPAPDQKPTEPPQVTTLPDEKYPINRPTEPLPEPAAPRNPTDAVKAAIDTLVEHLLEAEVHWKAGVPDFSQEWVPITHHVGSNQRPAEGQPDIEAARRIMTDQVVVRIYAGPNREKIANIFDQGSTYFRAVVLPWTKK